ncbi:hypothetical protein [Deinococcus sp.]|uniref:hypothetical protein n=1 Tax=Deinococcus sp. TaxID=47478 RepID=UPI003B598013
MNYVVGFLRFCYDFVVGDDWRVAAAVVVALALTVLLAAQGWAWLILPLAVLAFLGLSVWRVAQKSR